MALLAANTMWAQSGPTGQEFKTVVPNKTNADVIMPGLKPNEVHGLRPDIKYSGIAVQAVKTDNPLQLINPFAPLSYGNGADNLDRDIITGRDNGLKFFAIGF